jgi:hypothetical protein
MEPIPQNIEVAEGRTDEKENSALIISHIVYTFKTLIYYGSNLQTLSSTNKKIPAVDGRWYARPIIVGVLNTDDLASHIQKRVRSPSGYSGRNISFG